MSVEIGHAAQSILSSSEPGLFTAVSCSNGSDFVKATNSFFQAQLPQIHKAFALSLDAGSHVVDA